MSRMNVRMIVWGVLLCVLPGFAWAGQDGDAVVLDPVVVTATPVIEGNELDAYASQKTVVSETQIQDLNAQDIETALRATPGVSISRYNKVGSFGGGDGGGIFIRGMGSSRPGSEIKTMIDGVPMYMGIWNHPLLDLLPIDPASSIEVYKSPQPQYFGNAFAVLNIVPKKKKDEGYVTKAGVSGGSYETFVGTAEHGGKVGRFDYYLGGGYRTSEGHREDADGELQNLYGRLGYELTDNWDVSLFSLGSDNWAKDPGAEDAPSADKEGKYKTKAWLAALTLDNTYDNTDGYVKVYRSSGEGDWLNDPLGGGLFEDAYYHFLFYGVKAAQTIHLPAGLDLLAGVDWDYTEGWSDTDYSDGSSDSWDKHHFDLLSPYAALNWTIGSRDGWYAVPSAGVRYYEHSVYDSETAPHAGLIVGYRDTEMHVGYSKGVVYPGLEVVYMSQKVIPMLKDSWKDLDAETTNHYEAGVRQKIGDIALVECTFFYDDGHDRYAIVPPPPPPPTYSNIEDFTIKGIEASVSLNPLRDLSLFAGLTYLDTDPSDLPYAPHTTVNGGLVYCFLDGFRLSVDGSWMSEMYVHSQVRKKGAVNSDEVDSYFLANTKLSYTFTPESQGYEATVYVAGENITDEDYEYLPGYPMPGINFMLGASITF